jgi:hypothetical protein
MQRANEKIFGPSFALTMARMAGVLLRHDGHARLDAVDARLGQRLGDADLLALAEAEARLLLAVAQRDVVELHLLRQAEVAHHLLGVVPGAHEELVRLPGFPRHQRLLLTRERAAAIRSEL